MSRYKLAISLLLALGLQTSNAAWNAVILADGQALAGSVGGNSVTDQGGFQVNSANSPIARVFHADAEIPLHIAQANCSMSATNSERIEGELVLLKLAGEASVSSETSSNSFLYAIGYGGFLIQADLQPFTVPWFVQLRVRVAGAATLAPFTGSESRGWLRLEGPPDRNGIREQVNPSFGSLYDPNGASGTEPYVYEAEWLIPLAPGNPLFLESRLLASAQNSTQTRGSFTAHTEFSFDMVISKGPVLLRSADLSAGFNEVTTHRFSLNGQTVRVPRENDHVGFYAIEVPEGYAPTKFTEIQILDSEIVLHLEPFSRSLPKRKFSGGQSSTFNK